MEKIIFLKVTGLVQADSSAPPRPTPKGEIIRKSVKKKLRSTEIRTRQKRPDSLVGLG
ncbi:Receptor-like cytoplasmic kinase 176, partial [Frankliniella fusca]